MLSIVHGFEKMYDSVKSVQEMLSALMGTFQKSLRQDVGGIVPGMV